MKWIYLLIAGALEITWAVAMKMSNGFTVLIPSIVTGVGYIASAVFLAIARLTNSAVPFPPALKYFTTINSLLYNGPQTPSPRSIIPRS